MPDPIDTQLLAWCARQLAAPPAALRLHPVSGDASFRRYFRVLGCEPARIAVHAPPEKIRNLEFSHIAALLRAAGVRVPAILAHDEPHGFFLLEDFGDRLMLEALDANTVSAYYARALETLQRIQSAPHVHADWAVPPYSAALLETELRIFPEWFLQGLLGIELAPAERAMLEQLFRLLIDAARAQPQVLVHRDYHSRNLMLLADGALGVIDFQDAVVGPVTYDLAGLLRDCYIAWPAERVREWALGHAARLRSAGLLPVVDDTQFLRWFDWIGLQRHIKVLGIFARLWLRDGKPGYLGDLPRVLRYVLEVAQGHAETADFARWMQQRVVPAAQRHDWYRAGVKAMLLAAGLGKRLRPLTATVPKPLLPLAGKPMIEHHIERLVAAGIREFVINVSWLGEQIERHCGDGSQYGAHIQYSREPGAPLETGGGIRRALPLLGEEPFVLVAADVWCPYPFAQLAQNPLPGGVLGRLVVVPNPPQHPRGDFHLRADGFLSSEAIGEPCTYSCIALLSPRLFTGFDAEVFPLVQPLRAAAAADALAGEWWRGEWEDVGTPERYAALEQRLRTG